MIYIMMMIINMIKVLLRKIYHLLLRSTKVYCRMWDEGARSAERVDRPVQDDDDDDVDDDDDDDDDDVHYKLFRLPY